MADGRPLPDLPPLPVTPREKALAAMKNGRDDQAVAYVLMEVSDSLSRVTDALERLATDNRPV